MGKKSTKNIYKISINCFVLNFQLGIITIITIYRRFALRRGKGCGAGGGSKFGLEKKNGP